MGTLKAIAKQIVLALVYGLFIPPLVLLPIARQFERIAYKAARVLDWAESWVRA